MDRTFAQVATEYDRWVRTDIDDDTLIDALIEGSMQMAEQRDSLEDALATANQEIVILRQFVPVNERLLAENGALLVLCGQLEARSVLALLLGRAQGAWDRRWRVATGPDRHEHTAAWLLWLVLLACCVALYVRLGV